MEDSALSRSRGKRVGRPSQGNCSTLRGILLFRFKEVMSHCESGFLPAEVVSNLLRDSSYGSGG